MNFNDIPLRVPNIKKVVAKYDTLIKELEEAKSADEAYKVVKKSFKYEDELMTDFTVIQIRFSIDTTNEKYKKATEICDEISPLVEEASNRFNAVLLSSPYRKELETKLGKHAFDLLENQKRIFDPAIIEDLVSVNKLSNKYDALMASAQIEFKGELRTLSQLGKFMNDKDRETRLSAAKAYYGFMSEHNEEIGQIYDEMVHIRTNMAHKLGYKNYVELGYLRLSRLDYNSEMVANYRKQIYEVVVPVVNKLKKEQAKRIGIRNPLFIDYALEYKEGNPTPKGDIAALAHAASKMYHDMSEETGEFFDYLYNNNYMDLEAKKGKMGGGYMTYLPKYKTPFIFSNSNGTSQDVDTLTHEFGHAYQGYLGSSIKVPSLRMPTLESCEIDSMSMEFFAWPWMENFFGEDANKYRFSHLSGAISFLPYGVAVDEFQHFVYENPDVTHEERCKKWREIEKKYLPWKKYDGFDFLENGGFWMRQGHIFSTPFYYIDYTLAQVLALQFKCEMDKNREKAYKKYLKLLKMGGKYPFLELLEKAHLRNPFVDGNVKKVIQPQVKVLKNLKEVIE